MYLSSGGALGSYLDIPEKSIKVVVFHENEN